MRPDTAAPWLEVGVAGRPHHGEVESGDTHVVHAFDTGVLLAVIDGLGHGPKAAEAAHTAARALRELAGEPLADVVRACHERVRGTRGVVLSIASVLAIESTITWTGIGNVEGALHRASGGVRETLLVRGGVLGDRLPAFRTSELPLHVGDVLLFATDGIKPGFGSSVDLGHSAQAIADAICERFARDDDDALILAARWLGAIA
jgi:phosphoserine phosphatase RsbX